MNPSQPPQDSLLEACLDEILGGVSPPDLSDRILEAWRARQDAAHGSGQPKGAGAAAKERVTPPPRTANSGPSPTSVDKLRAAVARARNTSSGDSPAATYRRAALFVVVAATIAVACWWASPRLETAEGEGTNDAAAPRQEIAESPPAPPVEPPSDSPSPGEIVPRVLPTPDFGPSDSQLAESPSSQPPVVAPRSNAQIVEDINAMLAQAWREQGLISRPVDDERQWVRRVYLRLLGRIPTVAELESFADLGGTAPQRRQRLVDAIQQEGSYRREYAEHWGDFWTNVLIGRTGGRRGLAHRGGLRDYLASALESGRPFDQIAVELLTATGSASPEAPDYNGAVNYIVANWNPKAVRLTAQTARIFQGRRLRCAQCHQHPMDKALRQHDFWSLNAFFRQARVRKQDGVATLDDHDFAGEGDGDWEEAEIYYEAPDGQAVAAYPGLAGTDPVAPHGRVSQAHRRKELATRIVRSQDFPRAVANRLWEHFLGYGFSIPVDDMGSHNPPSHPDVLQLLAEQFAAHGFDPDRLAKWIVLSDAFDRSSGPPAEDRIADAPERGGSPAFSRYYPRQLPQEAVFDSLELVAEARSQREAERARSRFLGQFAREMNTDDGAEENRFRGDVRQALEMFNGESTRAAIDLRSSKSVLGRVIRSKLPVEAKVSHLFLAAIAREPTTRELRRTQVMINDSGETLALQDIWWALLNSSEFILDH